MKALILVAAVGAAVSAASLPEPKIDPQAYLEHVKTLASPKLKGRGTGTPELEKAAAYIEKQFKAMKLAPAFASGYRQPFRVTTQAKLGGSNRFCFVIATQKECLKAIDQFQPFNFSSTGPLDGPVVFAGYGITAPELNYDDYAGLDVKDKIVLVLRHEPQENDDKSVFLGRALTAHGQFDAKAINAKLHGARGLILVNDLHAHSGESDRMEKFGTTAGPNNAGIPAVQVQASVVEPWFQAAGKSLKTIAEEIDQDLQPRSFAFPTSLSVNLNVDIQRAQKAVPNVAAWLPGQIDEYIVIGAHYDHLGLGEQHSMAPSLAGTPHLGADDNASGTAGLVELARYFSRQPKPQRGILFVAFAAEELGLLGSAWFVENPPRPLGKAVAMINMDMIGRIRDNRVFIGGSGTGSTFKAMIDDLKPRYPGLAFDLSEQAGYGSSDHTSFTKKQVPVLFFFSGLHGDYHKPSDTWDKIDAPKAAELLNFIGEIAGRLAAGAERPQYVQVAATRPGRAGSGGGPAYGPWFGSIPDFAEVPRGFKFADVREGSPAAKAGLKAGDILIEFDGKPIQNLSDFTYLLRSKKPGDTVPVKVIRGDQTIEAKVLLTERR
jgi:Zn-dependent M28 family amino/carboxypeptidase